MDQTLAVIYARYSATNGEPTATLDDQIRACRKMPAVQACAEVSVITDEGVSGAKERPGLDQLAGTLDNPKLAVVAVYDTSRLARSTVISSRFRAAIKKRGDVSYWSYCDGEVTFTASGELMANVKAAIDQYYRDYIAQKMRDSYEGKRALGNWAASNAPYGYDLHRGGILTVNEAQRATVLRIWELALAGTRFVDIADAMNTEGRPRPKFRKGHAVSWEPRHIRQITINPVYIGRYEDGESGNWPKIIDMPEWEAMETRRKGFRTTRTGKWESSVRGYVRCSCGRLMKWRSTNTGANNILGYCRSRDATRADWCQEMIDRDGRGIREEVVTDWLDALATAWDGQGFKLSVFTIDREDVAGKARAGIEAIEKRIRTIDGRLIAETITVDEARAEVQELKRKRDQYEAQLAESANDDPGLDSWPGQWRVAGPADRRALIAQLFESITVKGGDVTGYTVRRDHPTKTASFITLVLETALYRPEDDEPSHSYNP